MSRPAKSTPDPVVTAALAPVVSIRISWLAAILSVPVWNAPEDSTRTLLALTAFVIVTVDAEDIRETSPPVEVRVAPVMFEISPVPESVMSPPACIAAVGPTLLPVLMVMEPTVAVRAPDPT
jgi:hypothetical protein